MLPTNQINPVNNGVNKHRVKKIITGIILVPIILFVMLIMVSFVANVLSRSKRISQGDYSLNGQSQIPAETYGESQRRLIEGIGNQFIGAANPKLTIVEFADFACPYCRESYPALRELSLQYPNDIKIIFRDWPGHLYSTQLALAAYCAGEQNKFWEIHDRLYQNQSETLGADKNDLARIAISAGIYNEQFQSCFDSQKYLPVIEQNLADSKTLGVRGTPTWFINGEKVEGTLLSADWDNILKLYGIK